MGCHTIIWLARAGAAALGAARTAGRREACTLVEVRLATGATEADLAMMQAIVFGVGCRGDATSKFEKEKGTLLHAFKTYVPVIRVIRSHTYPNSGRHALVATAITIQCILSAAFVQRGVLLWASLGQHAWPAVACNGGLDSPCKPTRGQTTTISYPLILCISMSTLLILADSRGTQRSCEEAQSPFRLC